MKLDFCALFPRKAYCKMNKNIDNFLNYTKISLAVHDIAGNFFFFMFFVFICGVLSRHLIYYLIFGFLYIILVSGMGAYFVNEKCVWGESLYLGLEGSGMAAVFFSTSYFCLMTYAPIGTWVLVLYIFIYILCCACFNLNVWNRIKKDAYGKNNEKSNPVFAWIGSGAGMLLAPVIFSGFNENQFWALLGFLFLFLGTVFTATSFHFLEAYLLKNFNS